MALTQAHPLEVLRKRTSEKWRTYPDDVLPMFVAEMDFPLAPAIRSALHDAIELGDTGYVDLHEREVTEAFANYAAHAWGWSPSPERMGITTDVSVVIVESLRRLTNPGDAVVITPPIYPPFFDLIPEAGGVVTEVPLLDDGRGFSLDLDGIDRALAAGAKGVLLCNPHNPVGLVPDRATLADLSRIVDRHGGFVVSDEIHAPLTHSDHRFVPYLSVSDEARDHGIAAVSASKAFNLAGLKCAMFVAESAKMTALIAALPEEVTSRAGLFGVIATRAGLVHGRDWLAATISALEANLDLLEQQLAQKLPGVRLRRPGASYLAWLDMAALEWGDDPASRALTEARVALSSGLSFGAPGRGYARMNIGCDPSLIVEAIDRLSAVCGVSPAVSAGETPQI